MTKAEDDARLATIKCDPIADIIYKFIEALPHHTRLYPDLYSLGLAEKMWDYMADMDDTIDS